MITDKLRFVRWKRLANMADEVNAILVQKGITATRAIPPKIALPLIEQASLEEDPDLQTLWNHLLANAMDPSFNDEIRYGFIDMIKNITGMEAALLNTLYDALRSENGLRPLAQVYSWSFKKEAIMGRLNLDAETYSVAANNLMRMQLISPAILKSTGVAIGGEPVTTLKGIDQVTLTPLGVKFVEACIE